MAEKKKKKKSSVIINCILGLMLVAGLSLMLYPTVSDWWNDLHQSRAVAGYVETVDDMSGEEKQCMLEEARAYNERLAQHGLKLVLSDEEIAEYESLLDITGTGIMAYIEIPKIKVQLPIYHGTDDTVLQIAVGHLPGTSLPVGGIGTHAVMSGHRGLPSAKLLTDLDKLKEGDLFMVRVLDEVLTYEIDQILVVEPNQTEAINIDDNADYCTLVTCTPYGVNSHRLLVRGHRVANLEDSNEIMVTADAVLIDPVVMTPIVAVPMALVLFLYVMLWNKKRPPEQEPYKRRRRRP